MKYLDKYLMFESRSKMRGREIPFIKIFSMLPQTLDYRILEWMIENWGETYQQSPVGQSYYNKEKDWDTTIDETLRLSDHWDFYARYNNDLHCHLNKKIENNTEWTIAKYDEKTETYISIISFPFIYSKENKDKKRELRNNYVGENKIDQYQSYEKLHMLQDYMKQDKLFAKYERGELIIVGKVQKLKRSRINIDGTTYNHNAFEKAKITFYVDDKIVYVKEAKNRIDD